MEERVSTPVCYRHPDRPTRLACTVCERPICTECSHDAAVGQRCPDHAGTTGRHRVIQARRTTGFGAGLSGAPFVKWTLYITVGIYAVSRLSDFAGDRSASDLTIWLYDHLSHYNRAIADGEVWRLVTSALLHSRAWLLHILFNMYALYLFGPALERRVGSLPFAALYVASAAMGGAFVYALGGLEVAAVGASGAIFGLFGAWLYASWLMRSTTRGRQQFNQLAVLLAINLALPLFVPSIAWQAHVGGLLGGMAIAWGWNKFAVTSDHPEARRTMIAVGMLIIAVGAVLVI